MALTSVGAFYATQSLLLQRVYIPYADDSEIDSQPIQQGETLLKVAIATYQSGGAPAIQALIGTPTINGICAVVNGGLVSAMIIADPALYSDPAGGEVISCPNGAIGDSYNGTIFTRLYAEVSYQTGAIVSTSLQNISAPTVATTGNYLIPVASTAQVGQIILASGLIGKKSGLIAAVVI
jgi:hypothetical protein